MQGKEWDFAIKSLVGMKTDLGYIIVNILKQNSNISSSSDFIIFSIFKTDVLFLINLKQYIIKTTP